MVKRYEPTDYEDDGDIWMHSTKDGEYVKYTDYAALLEAAKLLGKYQWAVKNISHTFSDRQSLCEEAWKAVQNNPIARALIEGKEVVHE